MSISGGGSSNNAFFSQIQTSLEHLAGSEDVSTQAASKIMADLADAKKYFPAIQTGLSQAYQSLGQALSDYAANDLTGVKEQLHKAVKELQKISPDVTKVVKDLKNAVQILKAAQQSIEMQESLNSALEDLDDFSSSFSSSAKSATTSSNAASPQQESIATAQISAAAAQQALQELAYHLDDADTALGGT